MSTIETRSQMLSNPSNAKLRPTKTKPPNYIAIKIEKAQKKHDNRSPFTRANFTTTNIRARIVEAV